MRKPIVSGVHCPFNCTKFEQRQELLDKCRQENRERVAENQKLLEKVNTLNSQMNAINYLPLITEGGHQILGIEHHGGEILASFMLGFTPGTFVRTVYLVRLPLPDHKCAFTMPPICCMYLNIYQNGNAVLKDWKSHDRRKGYGTMLMNHVIRYLQSANIQYLGGYISEVDYDHKEDLLRFYSRFGFQITKNERKYDLLLNLAEAKLAEYTPEANGGNTF